jgi:hypothetical protein
MVEGFSAEEASAAEHSTVLLKEAVDGVAIDADGLYIDGTFGRGGHTAELLSRLSEKGSVIAIDKDLDAIAAGQARFAEEDRLTLVHASFAELAEIVKQAGKHGEVAGVLLDLGVSSPQLDVAERGFSFLRDGPLDMRMDTSKGLSRKKLKPRSATSSCGEETPKSNRTPATSPCFPACLTISASSAKLACTSVNRSSSANRACPAAIASKSLSIAITEPFSDSLDNSSAV